MCLNVPECSIAPKMQNEPILESRSRKNTRRKELKSSTDVDCGGCGGSFRRASQTRRVGRGDRTGGRRLRRTAKRASDGLGEGAGGGAVLVGKRGGRYDLPPLRRAGFWLNRLIARDRGACLRTMRTAGNARKT